MEALSERLTALADASLTEADMEVNMDKTFSQHVHKREDITVTAEETKKAELEYEHKCDFCPRRFKSLRGMRIHRARCQHNYGTTDETYVLEHISDVFGHDYARWFLVKWKGHDEPEWERGHLLRRDGCDEAIRDFWSRTGLNPSKKFYPDSQQRHRCTIYNGTFSRAQDLKAHCTRMGHHECKTHKVTATAVKDAILEKRKQMQKSLPKAMWGKLAAKNAWHVKYLGSIFEAGGGQMADVRARIAMTRQRFSKMHHLWKDKALHLNLRMRLYKAAVCSILTYGSEAWTLDKHVRKAINGANASMVSIITGREVRSATRSIAENTDLRLGEMGAGAQTTVARTHTTNGTRQATEKGSFRDV